MNSLENPIYDTNFIVDCDEILVNISPKWAKLMAENEDIFRDYFNLEEIKKVKDDIIELTRLVLLRKEFYLTDWLKKKEVDKIPDNVMKSFMDLYDTPDFYYDLPLNKISVGLRGISFHRAVKKIYVVTRCTSLKNYKSKCDIITNLFPERKLEIIKIGKGEKKSSCLSKIDIENGFIFEDENSNIVDYLDSGITKCNLYVPILGYNRPTSGIVEKAHLNEVSLNYY